MLLKSVSIVSFLVITGISTYMYKAAQKEELKTDLNANSLNDGKTVQSRFETPEGFERVKIDSLSFGQYLRNFELHDIQHNVLLFNGTEKRNKVHASVLKIDVGTKDLQQCADACMRLRAEYLFKHKRFNEIEFAFTNGFSAKYKEWRLGKRILVNGNKVSWSKKGSMDTSHESFRSYLDKVFTYAGTLSLKNSLKKTSLENLNIGDILLQGGSPGHAVTVIDMAKNAKGQKIVMLAQSYMPAQEIHILKNTLDPKNSPWFLLNANEIVSTPEWDFEANSFRKW